MCAITVQDRDAGVSSLALSELRHLRTAKNEVIVEVHTAKFAPRRAGLAQHRDSRDRTPSVRSRELSGVVTELGYGTTGLTIGQRWFSLTRWTRDSSLAPSPLVRC
ncbi:hypothetical protein [Streptomyces chartreusis]